VIERELGVSFGAFKALDPEPDITEIEHIDLRNFDYLTISENIGFLLSFVRQGTKKKRQFP